MFVTTLVFDLPYFALGSSASLPLSTLGTLLALWLGVSMPLTLLGSYFGFRQAVRSDGFCGDLFGEQRCFKDTRCFNP